MFLFETSFICKVFSFLFFFTTLFYLMFFMVKLMLPNVNNQVVKISSVIIIKKYLRPLIRPEVVLLYVTRVKSRNRSSNNIDKRVFQIKQTITVRNSFFFFFAECPSISSVLCEQDNEKKRIKFYLFLVPTTINRMCLYNSL